jgi:hypothetical protein
MAEAMPVDPGLVDDLKTLGIVPAKADRAELFYEGHGNSLYRVAEGANN